MVVYRDGLGLDCNSDIFELNGVIITDLIRFKTKITDQ